MTPAKRRVPDPPVAFYSDVVINPDAIASDEKPQDDDCS